MFSTGLLVTAGATICVALLEKFAEDHGIYWLGMAIKVILPIVAMIMLNNLFTTSPIMRWLK